MAVSSLVPLPQRANLPLANRYSTCRPLHCLSLCVDSLAEFVKGNCAVFGFSICLVDSGFVVCFSVLLQQVVAVSSICDFRCGCGSSSDLLRETRDYRISPCVNGEARFHSFSYPPIHFSRWKKSREGAMVFIGWEEGKRSMVPQDQVPSRLLKPQSSSAFNRHGIETFEGWIRIQYAQPEWYELRLAMFRWEFTILGDKWTIYKHANAYEEDWQTHQDFMGNITGQGHQACVDGLQWYVIDRADQAFKDVVVHTVDGVRSPFDPDQHNWVLPHGILLLEPHKQWKKMLAFVITQTGSRN